MSKKKGNILAICRKQQETAFGGDCFILDSRFRGNDNRLLHLAKVLRKKNCIRASQCATFAHEIRKGSSVQTILEKIKAGEILFCDGAMGTFLQAKGLAPGECPELWCLEHPEDVKDIHREYRLAGSDIVESNSFGGSRYKLKHYGLENRVTEINRAAAHLAREVASDSQYVLGSVGPTGQFMAPLGVETEEGFAAAFAEQITALAAGGADAVIIETMTALEEAAVAVRAALEHKMITVIASFTFDPQAKGGYASMMGVRPEGFAEAMIAAGAHIIGANCGTGPADMIEIVKLLGVVDSDVPIMAMPNAGMPVIEDGRTVFKETPEQMADLAPRLVEAGANIIGGCCGTGPDHIAAMRKAVRSG